MQAPTSSPATETPKAATPAATARVAPFVERVLVGLAGLGLFVGFFLPWVQLADMVALSGLALVSSGGQAIDEISGPYRMLLAVVPLSGLLLFAFAVRGTRGIAWLGLACSALVVGVGLYTLVSVFLDAIGSGLWMVTGCTLVITAVGLIAYRNATK